MYVVDEVLLNRRDVSYIFVPNVDSAPATAIPEATSIPIRDKCYVLMVRASVPDTIGPLVGGGIYRVNVP